MTKTLDAEAILARATPLTHQQAMRSSHLDISSECRLPYPSGRAAKA